MAKDRKPSRITTDDEINKYYSGKQIKQKTNYFRLLIEILFVITICYVGYLFLTNKADLGNLLNKSTDTYMKTTVDEIYKGLKGDEASTVKMYKGEYIELTGRYTKKKDSGFFLGNVSGTTVGNGVYCNVVDDIDRQNIKNLNVGAKVTVKGKVQSISYKKGLQIDVTSFVIKKD